MDALRGHGTEAPGRFAGASGAGPVGYASGPYATSPTPQAHPGTAQFRAGTPTSGTAGPTADLYEAGTGAPGQDAGAAGPTADLFEAGTGAAGQDAGAATGVLGTGAGSRGRDPDATPATDLFSAPSRGDDGGTLGQDAGRYVADADSRGHHTGHHTGHHGTPAGSRGPGTGSVPGVDSRTLLPVTPDPALPGPPVDHVVGLAGLVDVVAVSARATSQVFRGREPGGETVAIKVYTTGVHEPGARMHFERQLAASEELGLHPNLMIIFRFGVAATGHPFVVMPWYDRGSLGDELWRRGPTSVPEALRIGTGIAAGLAYAHAFGFVHRAVKPTNVLVSLLGEPVLADFAIGLPDELDIARTPAHASPELWDGEAPTAASDVWSLCSTLYAALAGRPPFGAGSPPRLGDITLPPLPRDDVPPALVAVLEAGLARRPEDRPTADELADHLRWIARQTGVGAEGGEDLGADADANPRGMPRPEVAPQPVAEVARPPRPPSPADLPTPGHEPWGDRTGAGTGSSAREGTPTTPPRRPEIRLGDRVEPAAAPEEDEPTPPAPAPPSPAARPTRVKPERPMPLVPRVSTAPPASPALQAPALRPPPPAPRPVRATHPQAGPARPAPRRVPRSPSRPPRPQPGPARPHGTPVDLRTAATVFGVLAGSAAAIAVVAIAATTLLTGGGGQTQDRAERTGSEQVRSTTVSSQTRIPAAPQAPRAATGVRVTGATSSTVTLAWRDTNGGRSRYVVVVDAGTTPVPPQPAATATSHVVRGLRPSTAYCFTVQTGTGDVTPVATPVCARTTG
jgi:serine/threonine protein kinase